MRVFATTILLLSAVFGFSQVRPDFFPEVTSPDSSNFELYSQKNGLSRRANLWNLKRYFTPGYSTAALTEDLATGDTIASNFMSFVTDLNGDIFYVDGSGIVFQISTASEAMLADSTAAVRARVDTLQRVFEIATVADTSTISSPVEGDQAVTTTTCAVRLVYTGTEWNILTGVVPTSPNVLSENYIGSQDSVYWPTSFSITGSGVDSVVLESFTLNAVELLGERYRYLSSSSSCTYTSLETLINATAATTTAYLDTSACSPSTPELAYYLTVQDFDSITYVRNIDGVLDTTTVYTDFVTMDTFTVVFSASSVEQVESIADNNAEITVTFADSTLTYIVPSDVASGIVTTTLTYCNSAEATVAWVLDVSANTISVTTPTLAIGGIANRLAVFDDTDVLTSSEISVAANRVNLPRESKLAGGTTAQRPSASGNAGLRYYNTTTGLNEWSNGSAWRPYSPWVNSLPGLVYDAGVFTGHSVEIRGNVSDGFFKGLTLENYTTTGGNPDSVGMEFQLAGFVPGRIIVSGGASAGWQQGTMKFHVGNGSGALVNPLTLSGVLSKSFFSGDAQIKDGFLHILERDNATNDNEVTSLWLHNYEYDDTGSSTSIQFMDGSSTVAPFTTSKIQSIRRQRGRLSSEADTDLRLFAGNNAVSELRMTLSGPDSLVTVHEDFAVVSGKKAGIGTTSPAYSIDIQDNAAVRFNPSTAPINNAGVLYYKVSDWFYGMDGTSEYKLAKTSDIPTRAYASLKETGTTSLSGTASFTKITGLESGLTLNATLTDSTITVTNAGDYRVRFNFPVEIDAGAGTWTVQVKVYQQNAAVPQCLGELSLSYAGSDLETYTISGEALVTASASDVFDIRYTATLGATSYTLQPGSFTIEKL